MQDINNRALSPNARPSARRLTSVLLAAGLVCGPGGLALAQTDGWYVGAEGGVNLSPKIKFDALANSWQQSQDPGYALAGQVGYGFGNIRLEGEVGWRQDHLKSFTGQFGNESVSGHIGGVSIMGNLLYDFTNQSRWTPYLGVGIGGLDLAADHIVAGGSPVTDDSKMVFAYQGIAGLSYALSDRTLLRADYHYLRSEKANLALESGTSPGSASGAYASHAIMLGFTLKFPPAAAPVPVAAPVPRPLPPPPPIVVPPPKAVQAAPIAKNYMVFFDWDKDVLTPEAEAIIRQAADAAKKTHSVSIALTGYTDSSGTVPYNLKLSVRRGESVKKMLEQLGFAGNEITVIGKGESDQLVPTADGVREPQNRRVTIILP